MTHSHDEAFLLANLAALAPRQRTVFAVACALRTRPYFGYPEAVPIAPELDYALAALVRVLSDVGTNVDVNTAVGTCEENLDPDDDAVASVIYASRAEDPQSAVWCARRAYNARDRHVIEGLAIDINEHGAERRAIEHSIVQAELASQRVDLIELQASGQVVRQIIGRASDAGKARPVI